MKWFGKIPFSNMCQAIEPASVPVGAVCGWCDEAFIESDEGYLVPHVSDHVADIPYHAECWCRQIYGSVGHQRRECRCFGGTHEELPG